MAEINIRPARREDMVDVFRLVRDLAIYEKMEDQIEITLATLETDGFDSPSPAFKCLIAETKEAIPRAIGYALYFTCYSTWLGKSIFLEDLYVMPEYRKGGCGKKLFLAVAKIASELSCRMDFHVLEWNEVAIGFYMRLGAVCLTKTEKWNLYRLSDEALKKAVEDDQ